MNSPFEKDLSGLAVTIVGMHYAPETTGNAPYTTAMAQAIAAAGAEVDVVTGIPHYPQWKITDSRYLEGEYWSEVRGGVRISRCKHHVPREPGLIGRARMEATFFRRSLTTLKRTPGSVVIAVTPTLSALGAAVAVRGSRPLGAVVQDLTGQAAGETGVASGRIAGAIAKAEYALLKRCDQIGVITPRFGEVLANNGVDQSRVVLLPNFSHIHPARVSSTVAREKLGWAPDRFTVVHTGNMGRKQGLEIVVRAARLAYSRGEDIDFVLVGDGNQRRALAEMGAGLPNLRFVAPLEESLYPYSLAAADVLVLTEAPGVREMSMPSKLTSYTAAARPVVAALEVGGITLEELNKFHAAVFAAAGRAEDLLAKIVDLRSAPALREATVRGGQDLFRQQYGRKAAHARYVAFAAGLADRITESGARLVLRQPGRQSAS